MPFHAISTSLGAVEIGQHQQDDSQEKQMSNLAPAGSRFRRQNPHENLNKSQDQPEPQAPRPTNSCLVAAGV